MNENQLKEFLKSMERVRKSKNAIETFTSINFDQLSPRWAKT
jgi:hypothetical protein